MTFGKRLNELRLERGMSMEEVADAVGLSRTTIFRYENGTIENIPPEKVHRIAKLFGVSRPYMMGWTNERHDDPGVNLDIVANKLREDGDKQNSRWVPAETIDCITAATQALRALVKFKISRTPIYPQQILQASSMATLVTFDEEKDEYNKGTIVSYQIEKRKNGNIHYAFHTNNNAPIGFISLSLAVYLGDIYLGHGLHHTVNWNDARCFAMHLMFPRPVIKLLDERGYAFTEKSFAKIFGFYDWCIDALKNAPPVETSPELNRLVKEQFTPYIDLLDEIGELEQGEIGEEKLLDLKKYMAGYEE